MLRKFQLPLCRAVMQSSNRDHRKLIIDGKRNNQTMLKKYVRKMCQNTSELQRYFRASTYKSAAPQADDKDKKKVLYPHKYETSMSLSQFLNEYATSKTSSNLEESVAGRIVSLNSSENDLTATLGSLGCELKVILSSQVMSDAGFKPELGDIIGITGKANWCQSGNVFLQATKVKRLAPCLKDIESIDGSSNIRYIDLIKNPESLKRFQFRSKLIATMEKFLEAEQFLEVETPITTVSTDFRNVRPFITYHNEIQHPLVLRNSSHRHLKMLGIGGLHKVFELGKQFQKIVNSANKSPEFITCELCVCNGDYKDAMELFKKMLVHLSSEIKGSFPSTGDISSQFSVVDIVPALESIIGQKLPDGSPKRSKDFSEICNQHGVQCSPSETDAQLVRKLIQDLLVKPCISPTFLINPPASVEIFSKPKENTSEHFYFCVNGKIIAWGSSILNDPSVLENLLTKSSEKSLNLGNSEFITALEHGIYPSYEMTILVDHLVSAYANSSTIKDVILFPMNSPSPNEDLQPESEIPELLDHGCMEESEEDEHLVTRNERRVLLQKRRLEGDLLYNGKVDSTISLNEYLDRYNYLKPGESSTDIHCINGRITSVREASQKLIFVDVSHNFCKLQVVVNQKFYQGDMKRDCRNFLRGDIISVRGEPLRTKRGELSLRAHAVQYLTPCIRGLPHSFVGLSDLEDRYRKRYIDLIMNKSTKDRFETRARVISYTRQFLENRGFHRVETPILNSRAGGASATPFVTQYGSSDLFLRIAPELFLKMLVTGGMERVYEIGKQFRNEGHSRFHNPEFTSCEFYMAYADYNDLLDLTEKYLSDLVYMLHESYKIQWGKKTIDFTPPFKRIQMVEELEKCLGKKLPDPNVLHTEESNGILKNLCREHDLVCSEPQTNSRLFDKLVSHLLETRCNNPTFILNHPKLLSPLAKDHRSVPGLTERFELFVGGKEICDAYTELNDPLEQRRRFELQIQAREAGDTEAQDVDEDFLKALEIGLPPTAGWGMGIDRLCMLLADADSIREILLFPMMKPKKSPVLGYT